MEHTQKAYRRLLHHPTVMSSRPQPNTHRLVFAMVFDARSCSGVAHRCDTRATDKHLHGTPRDSMGWGVDQVRTPAGRKHRPGTGGLPGQGLERTARLDDHHSRAHTRVGTGFHCTVLVTAHCPALRTGIGIVRVVPSALASNRVRA